MEIRQYLTKNEGSTTFGVLDPYDHEIVNLIGQLITCDTVGRIDHIGTVESARMLQRFPPRRIRLNDTWHEVLSFIPRHCETDRPAIIFSLTDNLDVNGKPMDERQLTITETEAVRERVEAMADAAKGGGVV